MLSEFNLRILKTFQMMYHLADGHLPSAIIFIGDVIEKAHFTEFDIDLYRKDPSEFISNLIIEQNSLGFNVEKYIITSWADMYTINKEKYSHLSEDEIMKNYKSLAEKIDIFQVSIYDDEGVTLIPLVEKEGALVVSNPPGISRQDLIYVDKHSKIDGNFNKIIETLKELR